ncbi:MAG: endonuclease/exonuclease/phosphatase family protein, partial [Flavobacteriales bacterium]
MKKQKLLPYISLIITFMVGLSTISAAQKKSKGKAGYTTVAFYNIENLFDTLDTPGKDDKEFLPSSDSKWNSKKYYEKLEHMSDVISQLGSDFSPSGPAVVGLCEVETKAVVEDLAKTGKLKKGKYQVVFHDGPDERGIDVALMYQKDKFSVTASKSLTLNIPGDTGFHTRDQLVVTGKLLGEEMHFIVCHWPSRRGGQEASNPHRIAAAKLARKIIDSLYTLNPKAKIVLMGDLNDDPVDESVKTTLGTTKTSAEASKEKLYNAMEEIHASGIGTLTYKGKWNLFDQMIVSPALINTENKKLQFAEAYVFNKDFIKEKDGKYKGEP